MLTIKSEHRVKYFLASGEPIGAFFQYLHHGFVLKYFLSLIVIGEPTLDRADSLGHIKVIFGQIPIDIYFDLLLFFICLFIPFCFGMHVWFSHHCSVCVVMIFGD